MSMASILGLLMLQNHVIYLNLCYYVQILLRLPFLKQNVSHMALALSSLEGDAAAVTVEQW